jgi:PAS domain S-box-containing protein
MPEGRSVNVNAPQPAMGAAREALRPSDQDCRAIVDSIPGHVVTFTADGDIEFVNQQWLDYLGKPLGEAKTWTNGIVHPDDRSREVATWNRSIEIGQPFDSECRFCGADGVFRWFHVRAMPERDTEGRIVRGYSLRTDIEERKQAENRLQLLLDVTNQVVSNLQLDDPRLLARFGCKRAADLRARFSREQGIHSGGLYFDRGGPSPVLFCAQPSPGWVILPTCFS